jgi:hypothetical protein
MESYYYVDDISVIDCTVGLQETNQADFSIYPSPVVSGNQLTVQLSNSAINVKEIRVFTLDGRMVQSVYTPLSDDKLIIRIEFPPGMYFLELITEDGQRVTEKFVVLD